MTRRNSTPASGLMELPDGAIFDHAAWLNELKDGNGDLRVVPNMEASITTMLNQVACGAGQSTLLADCTPLVTSTLASQQVAITAAVDFGGAHTGDVIVNIFGSNDGVNYNTVADEQFVVPSAPGTVARMTHRFTSHAMAGWKVSFTNGDPANALDSVSAYGNAARSEAV